MYRMHILPCLLLALAIGSACAQGTYSAEPLDMSQDTRPDLSQDMRQDMRQDMVTLKDMSVARDLTSQDMQIDHPKDVLLLPTQTSSSGGGTLVTTSHRVRLLIGAPQPVQDVTTSQYKIQLGAGAPQHGQAKKTR